MGELGQKLETMTPADIASVREMCLDSFKFFVQTMLPREFYDADFHGPLCDFVQYAPTEDLAIVMPRTHLKTTVVGTLYPVWRGIKDPNVRVLTVSNTADNAAKSVHEIKDYFESNNFLGMLFPEVIPNFGKTRWSDECACLKRAHDFPEGTYESAGTKTKVTRRHYNLIIEDDTVAPEKSQMGGMEQLPTLEQIEQAKGFHKQTMPLLINVDKDRRIVIGTRWSSNDLIEEVMSKEDAKDGGRFSTYNVSALKPDGTPAYKRFSLKGLAGIKRAMGEYMWSMLYLNMPLSATFLKFKPQNTRYWRRGQEVVSPFTALPVEGQRVVTVDPADPPTGKSDQCYTVAVACLKSDEGLFVLGYERGRFTEYELITKTLDLADRNDCLRIRIEADRYPNLSAGFKIAQAKRKKQYIIEDVKTHGRNKEDRISRLTPLHDNGMLFLREGMSELETEMYQFPRGSTVDLLDALAWQVLDDYYVPTEVVQHHKPVLKGGFSFEQVMDSMKPPRNRLPFARQLAESN